MTLVSIDSETGRTVLFSLPRNLENVPFAPGSPAAKAMPGGWSCGDKCLLNGIYTWGQAHKEVFPGVADPGAEAMKEAVSGITGLTVNYYVLIDLLGFRRLIDAMDGIRVTVNQPVPIGGGTSKVSGYIQPGTQRLDGYHALWFARSRHGASDYARMERQRCVMNAMVRQLDPTTVLRNFQGIAAASKDVMSTDVPASQLATFIELATKAKSQKITSVQFVPPLVNPAYPDFTVVRARTAQAIAAAEKPGVATPASGKATTRPATTASAARPGAVAASPSGPSAAADPDVDIASVCTAA
jgi:LCP family protein required for cell wall assembly